MSLLITCQNKNGAIAMLVFFSAITIILAMPKQIVVSASSIAPKCEKAESFPGCSRL